MKIALIYPPTADPTAPYLSVPALTGYLRARGIEVFPIDANIEAYEWILAPSRLERIQARIDERLRHLERKHSLGHVEQLSYATLWHARDAAKGLPGNIRRALQVLGDGAAFADPTRYASAVTAVDRALTCIGAAYSPLEVTFASYRTPFALLNMDEVTHDASPDRNPFDEYFVEGLIPRLEAIGVDMVGISMAFPGQIQPGYALALRLRELLSHAFLVAGGPAITQLMVRLSDDSMLRAVGPFHCVVLFEGERALTDIVRLREHGLSPESIVAKDQGIALEGLPCPDFDGLPLERYFSPEIVLPYDPSRGCYWGHCAFCHYGLAAQGTACYRERSAETIADHMVHLAERWNCRVFHLSHDCLHPDLGARVARLLSETRQGIRWSSDMRPERSLSARVCDSLAEGGALSVALGIESGSEKVLRRMAKGVTIGDARSSIINLAGAGIAVEAMCFTDFPGESYDDAIATVRLVEHLSDHIALFVIGAFGLVCGSRVATHPGEYGIRTWSVAGDELGLGLFYEELTPQKSGAGRQRIDEAIHRLSRGWALRRYPWAGSLSTAHSLLWFQRHGPAVFRRASRGKAIPRSTCGSGRHPRFDLSTIGTQTMAREAEIWDTMVTARKTVTRALYDQMAAATPPVVRRTRAD